MKKLLLIFLPLLLFSVQTFAQTRTITGKITAEDGFGLPNATVVVTGTLIGVGTDIDGNYSIDVPSDAKELTVSYVSFIQKIITIGDQTIINVMLEEDVTKLDEVVVIGYGVQKKSLVTGAISKVNAKDLEKSVLRVEQALQGKTAGVSITQNSGSPGGGLTVRIRGTSTNRNANPLFIVDGMRTGGMDYLNPNDIESIEVLKDGASAAIYGAEAANGVIMITTKSGKKGNTIVSYNSFYGIQDVVNRNNVLNAKQYATYYRDGVEHEIRSNYSQTNPDLVIPDDFMNNLLDKSYPFNPDTLGEGTNWLDEIFAVAPMQEHNFSVSGGNEKTSVFFSGSYYTQDGIVGGSKASVDRYTVRLNADHEAKKWLVVGTKFSFTHLERKSLPENTYYGAVLANAMNIDPLTPVYYSDTSQFPDSYANQINQNFPNLEESSLSAGANGYYGMSEYVKNEIKNPIAQIANDHNKYFQDKMLLGPYLTLKPFKGFTFKTSYDIDLAYGNSNSWTPAYYYHTINKNYVSNVSQSTNRWSNWQWENVATYSREIGNHNITVLAGNTLREEQQYGIGGKGEYMDVEDWNFATISSTLSDTVVGAAYSYWGKDKLSSYFGRVQYNYKDKYMFNATLRYDGSSKLHKDNRFKPFPALSLGWIVSKENFWNLRQVSFLKFRASWGRNGTVQSLDRFMYVSTVGTGAEPTYYLSGGNSLTGAEPGRISNPGIVWETGEQIDIGFDSRFFNDRLAFTADYYIKTTKDLIDEEPVASYVGNNRPFGNIGSIRNTGVELELSFKGQLADLNYNISANAAYNKNEVIEVGSPGNYGLTMFEEYYPLYYFSGLKTDGMFDSFDEINSYVNKDGEIYQPKAIPGDVKFIDHNNDGTINDQDRTMIGSQFPDWTFGLNINLDYKGFDLSIFVNGTIGNEVYYNAYRTDLDMNNKPVYFYENAWTPEKHSDVFPRYTIHDNNKNFQQSDLFIFDGSFMRFENIELGYTFDFPVLDKLLVQKLRLYVSARNLFVLTKYPFGDPEVAGGVDNGLYPRPRIISFGVNLSI